MSGETTAVPKVFGSINKVMASLSREGINKAGYNPSQRYNFRSIDQVVQHLSPLLVKNKLFIYPLEINENYEYLTSSKENRTSKQVHSRIKVTYRVQSTEDASYVDGQVVSEALDYGDKSSNKAMSQAFKYFCFQFFCIPIQGTPDADFESPTLGQPDGSIPDEIWAKASEFAEKGWQPLIDYLQTLPDNLKKLFRLKKNIAPLKEIAMNVDALNGEKHPVENH